MDLRGGKIRPNTEQEAADLSYAVTFQAATEDPIHKLLSDRINRRPGDYLTEEESVRAIKGLGSVSKGFARSGSEERRTLSARCTDYLNELALTGLNLSGSPELVATQELPSVVIEDGNVPAEAVFIEPAA